MTLKLTEEVELLALAIQYLRRTGKMALLLWWACLRSLRGFQCIKGREVEVMEEVNKSASAKIILTRYFFTKSKVFENT